MSRWGKVDYKRLIYLQKKLKRLEEAGLGQFYERATKNLAARYYAKVVRRTPVGQYDDGRVGGTLRKNWTIGNVTKQGDIWEVEVFNNTGYGPYVNYGHRTRGGRGFVPGKFFVEISENEIKQEANKILQKELNKILEEAFSGD